MRYFGLLLCFVAFAIYADTDLVRSVARFHQWANSAYGRGHHGAISPAELHHHLAMLFAPDVEHSLNGKRVATSREDIYKRFLTLGQRYRSVDVVLPYDDVVVDLKQQKVAIQYRIHFVSHDGQEKLLFAQSIFKVVAGKMTQFDEISTFQKDHL